MNDDHPLFPHDVLNLAQRLISSAKNAHAQIVTAESCTGGLIAAALASVPGSSAALRHSFITYGNHAKMNLLGVPPNILKQYGAVSEQCARSMAQGAANSAHASTPASSPLPFPAVSMSATGVAGPNGGTPDKPVGLVHIAATFNNNTLHQRLFTPNLSRNAVRLHAVQQALALALQALPS